MGYVSNNRFFSINTRDGSTVEYINGKLVRITVGPFKLRQERFSKMSAASSCGIRGILNSVQSSNRDWVCNELLNMGRRTHQTLLTAARQAAG